MVMHKGICAVDGCERDRRIRDWCVPHYKSWHKYGDPARAKVRTRNVCTVDDCQRLVHGHGYCLVHYYRWRQNGDPLIRQVPWNRQPDECAVDGCKEPARQHEFCRLHAWRFYQYGDPLRNAARPAVAYIAVNEELAAAKFGMASVDGERTNQLRLMGFRIVYTSDVVARDVALLGERAMRRYVRKDLGLPPVVDRLRYLGHTETFDISTDLSAVWAQAKASMEGG